MPEKDPLEAVLETVQQNRYSDSSLYLADVVASLALGGTHRKVDLSRFGLLDEPARLLVFNLLTAKVKEGYPQEAWEKTADRILETTRGR